LTALRAALAPDDELIVVDSASRDPDGVATAATEAGAALVRCDKPGVNRARNAGWRRARHDVVLFTDDDVVVDPGWADALARAVRAGLGPGFVTGRVLPPLGQLPSRDVAIKRDEQPADFDAGSVGNLGHGASLAVPRRVLERLGGWDEALGAGGRFRAAPELDLFDRCFAAGLTGHYEPAALAWHDQWRGPRRLLLLEARYGVGIGARLAKLIRSDRRRARLVAVDTLWSWGLRELVRETRLRHGYPMLGVLVRLGATPVGFLAGLAHPIERGRFVT
jgi:glycosyltransferase involved in cell wall biosynthesis